MDNWSVFNDSTPSPSAAPTRSSGGGNGGDETSLKLNLVEILSLVICAYIAFISIIFIFKRCSSYKLGANKFVSVFMHAYTNFMAYTVIPFILVGGLKSFGPKSPAELAFIYAFGDVLASLFECFIDGLAAKTGMHRVSPHGFLIEAAGAAADNVVLVTIIFAIAPALGFRGDAALSPEINILFGIFRKIANIFVVLLYDFIGNSCGCGCGCGCGCTFYRYKKLDYLDDELLSESYEKGKTVLFKCSGEGCFSKVCLLNAFGFLARLVLDYGIVIIMVIHGDCTMDNGWCKSVPQPLRVTIVGLAGMVGFSLLRIGNAKQKKFVEQIISRDEDNTPKNSPSDDLEEYDESSELKIRTCILEEDEQLDLLGDDDSQL